MITLKTTIHVNGKVLDLGSSFYVFYKLISMVKQAGLVGGVYLECRKLSVVVSLYKDALLSDH